MAAVAVKRAQDVVNDLLVAAVGLQVDLVEHELHIAVLFHGHGLHDAVVDVADLQEVHADEREGHHQHDGGDGGHEMRV